MATFSVIEAAKAPPQPKPYSTSRARQAQYDAFVAGVKKGQVGQLRPSDDETARGVALRISRAGTRTDKAVQAWVVDGVVYFKVG